MVANTANTAKPATNAAPAPRSATGAVLPATAAPAPVPATVPAAPAAAAPAPAPAQYIALMVPGNPKKPNTKSYARWAACHVHGQTVAAYKAKVIAAGYPAGHAAADIAWEKRHGFITLHASAALCPAQPAAPAPVVPAAV